MDKTVVVSPETGPASGPKSTPKSRTPQNTSDLLRSWLYSGLIFLGFFAAGLVSITLLNSGWVNHMLNPVGADISMFLLIWPEQPLAALEFILTKAFLVFAHKDPRSALNLWTLEYDAITLLIYAMVAILLGRMLSRPATGTVRARLLTLFGAGLLVSSVTYMTAIEHCSGATWVGFVSLYGMGADGFDLYPIYQWILFLLGASLVIIGRRKHRT